MWNASKENWKSSSVRLPMAVVHLNRVASTSQVLSTCISGFNMDKFQRYCVQIKQDFTDERMQFWALSIYCLGLFSGFPFEELKNMPTWTTTGSVVPGSMQTGDGSVASPTAISSNAKFLLLLPSLCQEVFCTLISTVAALVPIFQHCYQKELNICWHPNWKSSWRTAHTWA